METVIYMLLIRDAMIAPDNFTTLANLFAIVLVSVLRYRIDDLKKLSKHKIPVYVAIPFVLIALVLSYYWEFNYVTPGIVVLWYALYQVYIEIPTNTEAYTAANVSPQNNRPVVIDTPTMTEVFRAMTRDMTGIGIYFMHGNWYESDTNILLFPGEALPCYNPEPDTNYSLTIYFTARPRNRAITKSDDGHYVWVDVNTEYVIPKGSLSSTLDMAYSSDRMTMDVDVSKRMSIDDIKAIIGS